MVIELTEVQQILEALAEEGILIKELDEEGEPRYRALRGVCLRCNLRIHNVLKCMVSLYPGGVNKPSLDHYKCGRCDRTELLFEGYVNEDNPKYDNFDLVWEYAHG